MKIELKSMREVEFIDPIEWVEQNNYHDLSLLTGDKAQSEFSLCGWNPVQQVKFKNDPQVWNKIAELIERSDFSHLPLPAKRCGWIGYLNYDLGRYLEELPDLAAYSYQIPEAILTLYKSYRYWDSKSHKCYEIEFDFADFTPSQLKNHQGDDHYQITHLTQECNQEEYCRKVETMQDYMLTGDLYEANLTQQFSAKFSGSPWALFRTLYKKNSAPFSAFLSFPELTICSISPEQFLSCEDRQIMTKPIKGTAPRGKSPAEDKKNREALMSSAKDLTELHMVVDLLRNDLSKVCEIGSVNVLHPNKLETFANVFHLVASVEGVLKEALSIVDLIKACFPGGSITGCPKIASMEVIEKLESYKRNLYTGTIFVLNNCFLQSSIVIRTGVVVQDKIFINSGGAITVESDPKSEYQEVLDKITTFLDIRDVE